jgi:nicotinamide-nucleotide amidase
MPQDLIDRLFEKLKNKNMKLVTAESCTGGFLAALITRKAGASDIFDRGYITYSNQAKIDSLGVPEEIIEARGAVSEETAEAMAKGALENSEANLAVSITGIAGPSGGSDEKPVGLVYFGYALKGGSSGSIKHNFTGNRATIQAKAAETAIEHLLKILGEHN